MANRYWVGGTGTWNTISTANWSATSGGTAGASVPTAADSVFFDQAATYTVTMTGALLSLDFTVSAGTVTIAQGTTPTLAVSGSMSLLAGTIWTNTGTITFNSTVTGKTITTNAVTITSSIVFDGIGGGWSLGSALTQNTATNPLVILTNGALDLNGFNITTGIFSSNNSNTRSIAFGSNFIFLSTTTAAQTVMSMAVLTGFSYTGAGGFSTAMTTTRTFTCGNTTGGANPNLFITSGTQVITFTANSKFRTLDFTGSATSSFTAVTVQVANLILNSGGTFTNLSVTCIDIGSGAPAGSGTNTVTTNAKTISTFQTNLTTQSVALTGALTCANLTVGGAGTIDFASFNATVTSTFVKAGTVTMSNIGTITCAGVQINSDFVFNQGTITCSGTFAVGAAFTYTSPAVLSSVVTFQPTSGATVTFNQNYTMTGTFNHQDGTVILNNNTLTVGIYSSATSTVREIQFGTGYIVLASITAGTTVLSIVNLLNFTWSGTGGFAADMSVTRTFTLGTTNAGTAASRPDLYIRSGASIPTLTTSSTFNKVDFTGSTCAPAGTLFNISTLILATGGTYNTVGFAPQFNRTQTWTPQFSKQLGGFGVNGTGITVTMGGTQTFAQGSTTTLTSGTLDLGGFDFDAKIFSSTNTNTRSIAFGSNNIILNTATAATTVLNMTIATGFTWTGTGGFVTDGNVTNSWDVARTVVFGTTGGTAANAPNLSVIGGTAGTVTITATSWFNLVNFTGSAVPVNGTFQVKTLTLATGGTYTSLIPIFNTTQTWTPQFSKQLGGFQISGTGITITMGGSQTFAATAAFTLSEGTLDLGGFDLTTGTFVSNVTTTRSIAFGSNNIILATTGAGLCLNIANTTGFTQTGTGGFVADMTVARTFTVGTSGTAQTIPPNLSIRSGASIPTLTTNSRFNNLDFTGSTGTPPSTSIYVNSFTLASGGTYTALNINMIGTGTITPNGKTMAALAINTTSGTTTFAGALACTTYQHTSGTVDFATFNLACSSTAQMQAGTLTNIGTITCTTFTITGGTLTLASGTITPSVGFAVAASGIFNYTTGTLSPVGTFTHSGGSVSFGKAYALTNIGTYTLSGGSLTLNGFDLTTGAFASTGTTARSIAFGTNNIILNYVNTGQTVLSFATATGFTYTGTGGFTSDASITRTYVFGTTGGSSTISPNLSLTGSGTAIQTFTTGSWFNKLDFGTTAFTIGLSQALNLNGLTLSSGGTFTNLTPTMVGTGTITSGGNTSLGLLLINSTSGTTTLAANLTIQGQTTLTSGTFNLNNFNLTCVGAFSSNNANTRSIQFGTGSIVLNSSGLVLDMVNATGFTRTGTGGFSSGTAQNRTFTFGTTGGSSTNAPNLSLTSGGSGTTPTITTGSWFNILDFSGCQATINTSLNLNGLTLDSGGTYTSLIPTMVGTGTITSNGRTLPSLTINSTSGTTSLGDAPNLATNATVTLTSGTLALNGFNLTTGIFSSTGSATRSIAFGTNNIVLAHTAASTTVLSCATATGFTSTGTGGFTADASLQRIYTFGTTGAPSIPPNLSLTGSGTAIQTFTTGGYFKTLDFGTTAFNPGTTALNLYGLTLSSGGTFTTLTPTMVGTGTITSNTKALPSLTINSISGTTSLGDDLTLPQTAAVTLTSGTLALNGFSLSAGSFISNNTNTRSIEFGVGGISLYGSSNPGTALSMADATNFTLSGTGGFNSIMSVTRTFTFGTTGGTSTNAPNLSLILDAVPTLTTGSWFNKLDFGSAASNPGTTSLNLNGLTLSSGGTYTGLTPTMVGTGTITPNSRTLPTLTINSTGTSTLAGNLNVSGAITHTQGTLALDVYNLTSASFASTGSLTRTLTGTNSIYTITGSGATAWSNASATGWSCSGITISMTSASAKTFGGGGATYSIISQGGAGVLTITGSNTFSDIQTTTRPSTITFTAGTTTTVSAFTLVGTAGNLITINSATPGTQFTLSKLTGTVNANYLRIQDSNATGGAVWNAGSGSVDVSNNTGWIFGTYNGAGNSFVFF